ncbi:MAG: S41 family peptidase [Alphaproteobacteria bacterium]
MSLFQLNLYSSIKSLLFGCFALVLIAPANHVKAESDPEETLEYLELFGEALERVRKEYVTEKSDKALIEAAIGGMLRSLDPHSVYLNEDRFSDLKTDSRGEFGGLGIEVTLDEASGAVKVVSPINGTPASKANIKSNDLIIEIDGNIVNGMSLSDAVDLMRGKVGEPITLTIMRGEKERFEVTIIRDHIRIKSVRFRMEGDVGYLQINRFNGNAESGVINAVRQLKRKYEGEEDNKITGYIIDMRNNPGGLLDQAVSISDVFLDRGEIVSTRGRNNQDTQRFQAQKGDLTDGLPLIVLINGGSASASEIVAGALQDHRRAIILGTKSFGKGSVQTMIPLSNDGAALKLTTQLYYTPSGKSIQGTGIVPDIYVPTAKLEVLENPGEIAERDLPGAIINVDEVEPKQEDSDAANNSSTDDQDYQLQRALDVMKAISIVQQG